MPRFDGIRRFIRLPRSREDADRDVSEELDFHLAMRTADLLDQGLTPRTANAEARRRFGDLDDARAELGAVDRGHHRRSRASAIWDAVRQDTGYAARTLVRQPAFAAGIVVTFALAIGANAAMFGVVDRLLLQPPRYITDPAHVARLYLTSTRPPLPQRTVEAVSYPVYETLRDDTSSFTAVAAYTYRTYSSGRGADAIQLTARLVTPSFFPTLGVRPVLGRFFAEDEARPPLGADVVVLSYETWQRRYGGDHRVLGHMLPIGARSYEIIGVAPPRFVGTDRLATDVVLPVSAAGSDGTVSQWNTNRASSWIRVVVRLRPGVTAEQAAARAVAALRARVDVPKQLTTQRVDLWPTTGMRGFDGTLTQEAQVARWLAALAGVVLLIACANIVNLMLSRSVRRRREVAVRLALGISVRRLVLALLAEGVWLAAIGGAAGLVVARWIGALLRGVVLDDAVIGASFVDGRVLAVTAAIAVGTGIIVGLVPALAARRVDVAAALKAGARGGAVQRSRLRAALLIAQAALSVVLLASAGLFARSLSRVRALDIGMDVHGLLLAQVALAGDHRGGTPAFFDAAVARVRALPGVADAAVAATVPFWSNEGAMVIAPGAPDSMPSLGGELPTYNAVTPEFFATLRTPVRRGRTFAASDGPTSPPVAIVSETFARHVWPGREAIGQCVRFFADPACRVVVGVVAPTRLGSLFEAPSLQLYVPLSQSELTTRALFVRTSGDPTAMIPAVRRALAAGNADLPYADVRPYGAFVDGQIRPWTLGASVLSAFAAVALAVAAVGLYSLLAYGVEQRRHEIAVRLALGATAGMVLRFTIGGALRLVGAGIAIGLVATLGIGGLLGPLLFETRPRDPIVLGAVAAMLAVVGLVGSAIPAWRASRIDAGAALRAE